MTRRALWLVAWLVPAILITAAVYELALAIRGTYAGLYARLSPRGEETVAAIAFLTMLIGALVAALHAARTRSSWALALFAPAAAAFVTARFYTYDPYYGQALRRYSNGGAVSPTWIFVVMVFALGAGAWSRLEPRFGGVATAVMLVLLFMTGVLAADGH